MKRLGFAVALIGGFLAGCLYALLRPRPPRPDDYTVREGWRPQAD